MQAPAHRIPMWYTWHTWHMLHAACRLRIARRTIVNVGISAAIGCEIAYAISPQGNSWGIDVARQLLLGTGVAAALITIPIATSKTKAEGSGIDVEARQGQVGAWVQLRCMVGALLHGTALHPTKLR